MNRRLFGLGGCRGILGCFLLASSAVFSSAMFVSGISSVWGSERETIRLGAALSLTGKHASVSEHVRRGYDLAVTTINRLGGVEVGGIRYDLEIVYVDDESSSSMGASAAERLILRDGIRFLLGPYGSEITASVASVAERHGVPMVEANGAARSLFTSGRRYLFAVLSTSEQYLSPALSLLAEAAISSGRSPNGMTAALAFESDVFSQDVRAGALEAAARHGISIAVDDRLPDGLDDMSATLMKVKSSRPDILLVSGHTKGAATAVRQLSEMGIRGPLIAITHCESADVISEFGSAAEGILCPTQWSSSLRYRDEIFGSSADFARTFEEVHGYVPPYQSAESSAAVLVFADAFERAATLDSERVRSALSETDLETFFGRIRFDPSGKNVAKPMAMRQIINGRYRVVHPSEWAEREAVISFQ